MTDADLAVPQHRLNIKVGETWRTVVRYDADRQQMVEDAAASLARATGNWQLMTSDEQGAQRRFLSRATGTFKGEG